MKYRKSWLAGTACLLLMLGACSAKEAENPARHQEQEHAMGDIREQTAGADLMPNFLKDKPEDMQIIYMAVAKHRDLLEKIPCYCGCGDSVGHKDNYDCFIHDNKEDGQVVWDDHGTKCTVCLEIAAKSIVDYSDGKSVSDIRAEIDKAYEKGYAPPTKTKGV